MWTVHSPQKTKKRYSLPCPWNVEKLLLTFFFLFGGTFLKPKEVLVSSLCFAGGNRVQQHHQRGTHMIPEVVHCHTHGLFNWSAGSGSCSSAQHLACRGRLRERGTKKVQIACEQSVNQFFYFEPPSLSLSSVGIYDIGGVYYFQWRFDCFIWLCQNCVCAGVSEKCWVTVSPQWSLSGRCEGATGNHWITVRG